MNVLLLGASGPIGQAMIRQFPGLGITSTPVSRTTIPAIDVLEQGSEQILTTGKFDAIVYLVNPNPDDINSKNVDSHVQAFERWLEASTLANVETFVLISSSAVYGELNHQAAFSEDSLTEPSTLYARLKLELEAKLSEHIGVKRRIVARVFNVFGPGCDRYLIESAVQGKGYVWDTVLFARDYLHVDDIARAVGNLLKEAPIGFGIWNVGSGKPTTNAEILSLLPAPVAQAVSRPYSGHTSWSEADISKLRELTGFAPKVEMRAYLQNRVNNEQLDRA